MKTKSTKKNTPWLTFTFIACCLFAGTILGQEKINSGLKNKTDTETQLHFKDAFVFKHIRLATSQFSVHQSMPSVAALEGKLDYKLSPASDKKYFILVFMGGKGMNIDTRQHPY